MNKKTIIISIFLLVIPLLVVSVVLSNRGTLVEIRNFLIFDKYTNLDLLYYNNPNQDYFVRVFADKTNISTFQELIKYREGKIRNKGFTDKIIFSQRLNDCFSENDDGFMCGCSDISEMVMAFCFSKNDQCFEIVNKSKHSIIYNRSKNIVIDLFYGFTYEGTLDELIYEAKNNSLDSSSKLVDLGQYIAAHIDLETINEINGNLLKSDLSNKKLTRDQLNKIRNNHIKIFKPWNEIILDSLGNDTSKLRIQKGQYYWKGDEILIPLLEYTKKFNNNIYLTVKEIAGYFYKFNES